jgi:hypothetical protein
VSLEIFSILYPTGSDTVLHRYGIHNADATLLISPSKRTTHGKRLAKSLGRRP